MYTDYRHTMVLIYIHNTYIHTYLHRPVYSYTYLHVHRPVMYMYIVIHTYIDLLCTCI